MGPDIVAWARDKWCLLIYMYLASYYNGYQYKKTCVQTLLSQNANHCTMRVYKNVDENIGLVPCITNFMFNAILFNNSTLG